MTTGGGVIVAQNLEGQTTVPFENVDARMRVPHEVARSHERLNQKFHRRAPIFIAPMFASDARRAA